VHLRFSSRGSGLYELVRPLKAFFLVLLLGACVDSPEAGLEELVAASREGSVEKIFPRLTERSVSLVQTAAMVGGDKGPLAFTKTSLPVEMISLTHQGGTSVMVVREGGQKHILPWIEEGGRWKVDLFLMTGFLDGDRLPNLLPDMNP